MRPYAANAFMKKCIKNSLLIWFLALANIDVVSQDIPFGTWRAHHSFKKARKLTVGNEKVFCAVENALFYYDLELNSSTKLGKPQGLGDVTVTSLLFESVENLLVVGYESGVIDLVYSDRITTLEALQEIDQFESRRVNDLIYYEDQVFAATDVGVVLVDIGNESIRDIYNEIGIDGASIKATNLVIVEDSIFVNTDQGLIGGSVDTNLLDFNNWRFYSSSDTMNITQITRKEDSIVLIKDHLQLWSLNEGVFRNLSDLSDSITSLHPYDNSLFLLSKDELQEISNNSTNTIISGIFENGKDFIRQGSDYFIADDEMGLLLIDGDQTIHLSPNGPAIEVPDKINFIDNKVVMSSLNHPGIDVLEAGSWTPVSYEGFESITDVVEFNNSTILSSSVNGIFDATVGSNISFFEGMDVRDLNVKDSWLYVTNYDGPFSVARSENLMDWETFSSNDTRSRYPESLEISQGNTIWVGRDLREGGGFGLFSPSEGRSTTITASSGLPTEEIKDFLIDRQDEMWVATQEGIVFFFDATFAVESNESLAPVFDDGTLFQSNSFHSLEIDGGNRRWFGTENDGLWLYNENLTEEIFHFTSKNSILPSNSILGLEMNNNTGELFITTTKGVVSYQTDSSEPLFSHKDVKVIPNPVSLSDNVPVTFTGIAANSSLKITNSSGQIMNEVNANGSTAGWNLLTFDGRKIKPGIYLIFSSTLDGEETFSGKFAIVP